MLVILTSFLFPSFVVKECLNKPTECVLSRKNMSQVWGLTRALSLGPSTPWPGNSSQLGWQALLGGALCETGRKCTGFWDLSNFIVTGSHGNLLSLTVCTPIPCQWRVTFSKMAVSLTRTPQFVLCVLTQESPQRLLSTKLAVVFLTFIPRKRWTCCFLDVGAGLGVRGVCLGFCLCVCAGVCVESGGEYKHN